MKLDVKQTRGVGLILTVGTGDTGQLGLGEDVMEKTRMGLIEGLEGMVDVCAGGMHSVGLSKAGEVWTWGCNDEGALGRKVEEEEEAFVPGKVDLEEKVVMVSAGDSHTAALTENGKVWIWGTFRDASGPIGLVTPMKTEMKPVKIIEDMVKISSGTDHLAMLREDGTIYTVGNAEQGQLGRVGERWASRGARRGLEMLLTPDKVKVKGKKNNKFKDVWAGGYDTVATSDDGKVGGRGPEYSALHANTQQSLEWEGVESGGHGAASRAGMPRSLLRCHSLRESNVFRLAVARQLATLLGTMVRVGRGAWAPTTNWALGRMMMWSSQGRLRGRI